MTGKQNNNALQREDVNITQIAVNAHPQYMDHETVYKVHVPKHNVTAFIGIHSTTLGPALGGIRYKHYEDENAALSDVLRLSEAMTWKNAAGALNHGGGKCVIMAPKDRRTPGQITLDVMAHALNIINENGVVYYGAQDMNMDETALDYIAQTAPWIKGVTSTDPTLVSGSPSPLTAIGVVECMKVAARIKLGQNSLKDLRISMQGLGAVGSAMAKLLHDEGAILTGCDINESVFKELAAKGIIIQRSELKEIYDIPADIFAPNAIGGTLNDNNIQRLKKAGVQIVCGAANNQQEDQTGSSQSQLMHKLGILYCPDYIVNAGGVIWVAMVGQNAQTTTEDIATGVPRRFEEIMTLHKQNPDKDIASLARGYAKKRIEKAKDNIAASQQGNALWFILVAIALLAALTMILTRSSSSVDQSGDIEQQRVKISQMLRYAKSLEAGIQQMRLRGISENNISFWHDSNGDNTEDASDTYFNANCTTPDCHLFNAGGAGLVYTPPPANTSNTTDWIFIGTNNVINVGTTAPDLILILPQIHTSVCTQINRMLNTSYGGTETNIDFTAFTGAFTATETIDLAAGQEAGCINYDNAGSTEPFFYHVLIKR